MEPNITFPLTTTTLGIVAALPYVLMIPMQLLPMIIMKGLSISMDSSEHALQMLPIPPMALLATKILALAGILLLTTTDGSLLMEPPLVI